MTGAFDGNEESCGLAVHRLKEHHHVQPALGGASELGELEKLTHPCTHFAAAGAGVVDDVTVELAEALAEPAGGRGGSVDPAQIEQKK
jgi:hypothetical protein